MQPGSGSPSQKQGAENHGKAASAKRAPSAKDGARRAEKATKVTRNSPRRPTATRLPKDAGLPGESRDPTTGSPETRPSKAGGVQSPRRHPSVYTRGPQERRFTRSDLEELNWNPKGRHAKPSIYDIPPPDDIALLEKDIRKLDPNLTDLMAADEAKVVTPSPVPRRKKRQQDMTRKKDVLPPSLPPSLPPATPSQKQEPQEQPKRRHFELARKPESVFSPEYDYLEPVLEHLTPKTGEALGGEAAASDVRSEKNSPECSKPIAEAPSESSLGKERKMSEAKREDKFLKRRSTTVKSQADTTTTASKTVRKSHRSSEKGYQAGSEHGELGIRKSRVTACALVIAVALLASLLIVSLQFILASSSREIMLYRCHTRQCLDIRANLTALLSKKMDPCEDFYAYVCDNWLNTTDAVSFVDYTIRLFYRQMNRSLHSSLQRDKDGTHILSTLYKTCHVFMTTRTASLAQMVTYARHALNVSAIFRARNSAQLFEYLFQNSLVRGFHTWFSIRFEYKGKKAYMHIKAETSIRRFIEDTLQEAGPGDRNYSFAENMPSYVRDVVMLLYTDNDVESQVQQLIEWDSVFDSVLQTPSVGQYKPFKSLAPVFRPISMGDVTKMINSMTPPNLALNPEDEILVHGFGAMAKVFTVMGNGTLASKALYFALYSVTNIVRFWFLRELVSGDQDAIIGACFKITWESPFHTWPYLITRVMNYDGRAVQARKMAETIRESAANGEMLHWMTKSGFRRASSDLYQLQFITYEKKMTPDTILTYKESVVTEHDFYTAYFVVKRIESSALLRWLPTDAGRVLALHQATSSLSLEAFRVESVRRIFVPSAYQTFPMFRYEPKTVLPFYINYPTVGVLVAREMVRAMGPPQKWDARTRRVYQEHASCLKKVRASLGLHPETMRDDWRFESFIWTLGSLLAYDAVRSTFLSRGADFYEAHFPTAQEMYFILSCQMTCSSVQSGHALSPKEQCLLPLRTNVDFLRYYNCSERAELSCVSSLFSGEKTDRGIEAEAS